jgi:hypothetical protein
LLPFSNSLTILGNICSCSGSGGATVCGCEGGWERGGGGGGGGGASIAVCACGSSASWGGNGGGSGGARTTVPC